MPPSKFHKILILTPIFMIFMSFCSKSCEFSEFLLLNYRNFVKNFKKVEILTENPKVFIEILVHIFQIRTVK